MLAFLSVATAIVWGLCSTNHGANTTDIVLLETSPPKSRYNAPPKGTRSPFQDGDAACLR